MKRGENNLTWYVENGNLKELIIIKATTRVLEILKAAKDENQRRVKKELEQ